MAYAKRRKAAPRKRASYSRKSSNAKARRTAKPREVIIRVVNETANAVSRPQMPGNVVPVRRAKF